MKNSLDVSSINFGQIDARNEILNRERSVRDLFLDSFYIPPAIDIDLLKNGSKFLIVGPKGSGKTALLRYLGNELDKKNNSLSRFIVFRDEVTEQDRVKIANLADFRLYSHESDETTADFDVMDCTSGWQIFIHREIVEVLGRNEHLFAKTPEIARYMSLVGKFFSNFETTGFKKLLSTFTKGRVKTGGFGTELEFEANFIDKNGNVDVSEFARYCNQTISRISFNPDYPSARINLFFDEVNLTFVSGENFRRNAVLVRDLVSACGSMNTKFSENQIPIYLYTALRREVISSVEGSVRELQKWVEDSGVNIEWISKADKPSTNQPLLKMLMQRISANEKRATGTKVNPKHLKLEDYFDERSFGINVPSFLIFETWGRPRDLVRLLTIAQSRVRKGHKFDKSAFSQVAEEYSVSCWEEKSDELNAKYSKAEILSIKRALIGMPPRFPRSELDARISYQCNNDPRAKQFFGGRNLEVVLEDLHKVGVLGNILKTEYNNNRPVYEYSDHNAFDSNEILCVHRSLWKTLNIHSPKAGKASQRRRRFQ